MSTSTLTSSLALVAACHQLWRKPTRTTATATNNNRHRNLPSKTGGGDGGGARVSVVAAAASAEAMGGGSSSWRGNAFAAYCDAALRRPEVSEGLRVLEQRHPELDPNVVLLSFWLAARRDSDGDSDSGGGGNGEVAGSNPGGGHTYARAMTTAEMRKATKISERWRWRVGDGLHHVEASLRGGGLLYTG
jgi:hypothetical protein